MEIEWTNEMLLRLMGNCSEKASLEKIEHIRVETKGKKVTFEIIAGRASEQDFEIETGSKTDINFQSLK